MRTAILLVGGLLVGAFPVALESQSIAVAPHVGTLGLGADVGVALSEVLGVRGGINVQPYSPEPDFSDVAFTLDLPSPSVTALLDIHPGGGAFRLSAGFVYFGTDLTLDATLDEPVEIGDSTYDPSELGTLTGSLVTNALAPYVGIGVGNASAETTGFFLDVGVAFHGTPDVELSASGPVASDPQFRAELDKETAEIRDDVRSFKVYPVVSLGLRFAVR